MTIKARIVKFGDNVDTDVILPGKYLTITDPAELGRHAMEGISKNFVTRAAGGAIIVAGEHFGQGSSREHAPIALKASGVKCVVANSFARIFFRNAISIGLPAVECPSIMSKVSEGDELSVDLEKGEVRNLSTGMQIRVEPMPQHLLEVLKDGGIIEHLVRMRRQK